MGATRKMQNPPEQADTTLDGFTSSELRHLLCLVPLPRRVVRLSGHLLCSDGKPFQARIVYCKEPFRAQIMTWRERITINPDQCGGRPCIRGMRIRVMDVLDLFAAGLSREEILGELPDLEAEDIEASLKYARERLDHPVLAA